MTVHILNERKLDIQIVTKNIMKDAQFAWNALYILEVRLKQSAMKKTTRSTADI